ncbi:MAG: 5-(carboxyamino)imidazole ribonucleotide synthase [Planctomycetota bacterium]|nr:5-(carboxyamino)imidazole ribonucleotide synthase [Planctomycetota bacterium]
MNTVSTSPPPRRAAVATLGIVGGGQLAKMTAQAAMQLGCEVVVLERASDFPAQALDTRWIQGDWDDPAKLLELAAEVDVVSLENEFVSPVALRAVESAGHLLRPSAATMALVQDKLVQKRTFAAAGLPLPRFEAVETTEDVARVAERLGWPLVLKRRTLGYDGKGNATVRSPGDVEAAWRKLAGGPGRVYAEEFCPFVIELAAIVVRGLDGATREYPVVETENRDHVCRVVRAPARTEARVATEAARIARAAVESIQGVGAFGVEMFLMPDGRCLVNEIAPRVHNTGHYTIEACATSQFENHVRAVLGLPLGAATLRAPAACMVNLLGVGPGSGSPIGLERALRVEGASIHVYGKSTSQRGRKMGHVTVLGATLQEAEARALAAADAIRFGEPEDKDR